MCIQQGYVPSTCKIDGLMCWLLIKDGKDPCKGCNYNRAECNGRYYDKYDSNLYILGTCFDNYIERQRQKEYESRLHKLHEKNKRAEEHAICNAKIILSIIATTGEHGKPEIELKVNDLIDECGYVRNYEYLDEAVAYIPAIIRKYRVGQIQCETNGFGSAIYDRLKDAKLGVDIVPLIYKSLTV